MIATKKEINEYIKESKKKYGIEITYMAPNLTKEDLVKMRKNDKKRNTKSILKSAWDLFPLTWCINIFARIGIASAVIMYLDSQGLLTTAMNIALILWMLMPFKGLVQDLYYMLKGQYIESKLNRTTNK